MSPHRYQRVDTHTEEDDRSVVEQNTPVAIPSSPPPSFRSRASSPTSRLLAQDPLHSEADRTLADTFGDDDSDSEADEEIDDRQRLMRGSPSTPTGDTRSETNVQQQRPDPQRTYTTLPAFTPSTSTTTAPRIIHDSHDGVFANMAAKPERGEKLEDLPPTYEQAAADAAPPYWETTIVAPGMSGDEVYVDGLPVGSFFSFAWNGMISTSFQLVGFLLTYLLHTTHAAKNGSRAGLGLTLVQYGFYMKGGGGARGPGPDGSGGPYVNPPDPNSHEFDPNTVTSPPNDGASDSPPNTIFSDVTTSEWISYMLMIVGWFILIRSISDYLRARRHEQLVLQSPDRGLPVPIIAEGERAESAV